MMIMMSQRAQIPLTGYPQPEVGYALSDSRVFISSRQVTGGNTWGKFSPLFLQKALNRVEYNMLEIGR